jgi:hypothetical protein
MVIKLTIPLKHIIQVLNETMNLLRGSRVNAALTIQLFSQLFHCISVWMFNKLISDQRSGLCSRYLGAKLTRRLNKIQQWAEKQGLELAADVIYHVLYKPLSFCNHLNKTINKICQQLPQIVFRLILKRF